MAWPCTSPPLRIMEETFCCRECKHILNGKRQWDQHLESSRHRRHAKHRRKVLKTWLLHLYAKALGTATVRGAIVLRCCRIPIGIIEIIRGFLVVPKEWTAVYFGERLRW